jgi:hypothetical protein
LRAVWLIARSVRSGAPVDAARERDERDHRSARRCREGIERTQLARFHPHEGRVVILLSTFCRMTVARRAPAGRASHSFDRRLLGRAPVPRSRSSARSCSWSARSRSSARRCLNTCALAQWLKPVISTRCAPATFGTLRTAMTWPRCAGFSPRVCPRT